jgi:hypothetical protein
MTLSLTKPVIEPQDRDEVPRCWYDAARGYNGSFQFGSETRPWNWMELSAEDADKVFALISGFVEYFNARYADRPQHRIPPCWAEHGALTEELTTLFFARWQAFESPHASVGGAQYWHAYTLPSFFERMRAWLGSELVSCQSGRHRDVFDPSLNTLPAWELRTDVIASLDYVRRRDADRTDTTPRPACCLVVEFLQKEGTKE